MIKEQIAKNNLILYDKPTLNRLFLKYFTDGLIIISIDNRDINLPLPHTTRLYEISNMGYPHLPVWSNCTAIDIDSGEKHESTLIERGIIVPNHQPWTDVTRENDNLPKVGKILTEKYSGDFFLYKPKGDCKESFWIDKNGNIMDKLSPVLFSDILEEYFTKIYQFKNPENVDKPHSLIFDFYIPQAPKTAHEAFQYRFGEHFFRAKE